MNGAGYYSYKWAEVPGCGCAFTRFRRDGIFSREAGGERFARTFFRRAIAPIRLELYRWFMGRDPDPDALLARSGLLVTSV